MSIPSETFFSIDVADMLRATAFYEAAFGATVAFASPGWTSLHIAGVRVALSLHPAMRSRQIGLHFAVAQLAIACADVERAGGRVANPAIEVAPGVVIAGVTDSEGNTFTLTQR